METSTGKLHYSESKSGSRTRRRWRIQYRGRTYHFERLAGETRLESYRRCSLLWEAQKVEIDALENPQNIRDQVVDVLTSMLGIAAGSGDTRGLQPVEYDASASLVDLIDRYTFLRYD